MFLDWNFEKYLSLSIYTWANLYAGWQIPMGMAFYRVDYAILIRCQKVRRHIFRWKFRCIARIQNPPLFVCYCLRYKKILPIFLYILIQISRQVAFISVDIGSFMRNANSSCTCFVVKKGLDDFICTFVRTDRELGISRFSDLYRKKRSSLWHLRLSKTYKCT